MISTIFFKESGLFNPSTNSSFRFNYSIQRCFLIQLLQPSPRRFQHTPPHSAATRAPSRSVTPPPCCARARVRNRRTHQPTAPAVGSELVPSNPLLNIHASMDPVGVADPSPSRRSVKRRPPARSPELLSPKAPGDGDAEAEAELIRRVEELEAAAARLRGEKEAAEGAARAMQEELDAERASAETATSEAMLMIERLQREKAAAQMEARQFRRFAEGRADRENEVQEELATLSDLAASYHSRLRSHGIDPDSFSDDKEELDVEEEEEFEQIDVSDLLSERNAGDASTGMEVKAMVVDGGNKEDQDEEPSSPVEKEFEYTVDVSCASTTKAVGAVVTEYVGDGNAGGLYARVEALEADRVAMRRELAALRAERAQLVMAREMARRLCWEMVAEQRAIVKKTTTPAGSFSMFGIFKVLNLVKNWFTVTEMHVRISFLSGR
jgi:hypothetical protein